jgi:hypothetical protein
LLSYKSLFTTFHDQCLYLWCYLYSWLDWLSGLGRFANGLLGRWFVSWLGGCFFCSGLLGRWFASWLGFLGHVRSFRLVAQIVHICLPIKVENYQLRFLNFLA